jgi:hypothetical protein
MLVQCQFGHRALEASVLIAQLADLPQPAHAELAVSLLPQVERQLGYPELSADIANGCPTVRLPQRVSILLFAEFRFIPRLFSFRQGAMNTAWIYFFLSNFSGPTSQGLERFQSNPSAAASTCRPYRVYGYVRRIDLPVSSGQSMD